MLKNDSLTAAAFVLSLLAIIFSVAKFNFTPSTDTFVGIMAGLIGVCATIMVGFQIFNSIDTRNKLKEIENIQLELRKELINVKNDKDLFKKKMNFQINIAKAATVHYSQPITSFAILTISFHQALQLNDVKLVKQAIDSLSISSENVLECDTFTTDTKSIDIIKDLTNDSFHQYELFNLIKDDWSRLLNNVQLKIVELENSENANK